METWKAIPGYEGLYEASDLGRIRSVDRMVAHLIAGKKVRGRVLSPRLNKQTGYLAVNLSKGNKRKTFPVHVLVALTFLGQRPAGMHVCHNDGEKTNCALRNLRYDTPKGNADDAAKHGTRVIGERHYLAKLTEEKVRRIRRRELSDAEFAREYGVCEVSVYRARCGIDWAHVV